MRVLPCVGADVKCIVCENYIYILLVKPAPQMYCVGDLLPVTSLITGAKGFEPLNGWTKTSCLTTWRRPNVSTFIILTFPQVICQVV
jgi:hypothetical protein